MLQPPENDAATLLDLIEAKWTTQALGVAAELGIADHLALGTHDVAGLACATGCQEASLHRLMRALAGLGICTEREDGAFELARLGRLLCAEETPSLRAWAIWSARYHWERWGHLIDSVRSGQRVIKPTSTDGYAPVHQDAGAAPIFNRAMLELTRLIAPVVAREGRFESSRRVADIGGGHGELLAAILEAHPHLQGLLFELPHAIEGARARIAAAGFESRCTLLAGDFFASFPSDCDAYLMKSVLHNWDDERCAALLANCRRDMPGNARVLIVDRVMPERITAKAAEQRVLRSDLNMLVGLGGRERTLAELELLLARAGLAVRRVVPMGFGYILIEAA